MPPLPSSPLLSPSQKYHIPTEYAVFLVDASASARTPCGLTDVEVSSEMWRKEEKTKHTQVPHLSLFLILQGVDPGDTWMDVALIFLREFFKNKILTSPADEAAIVFYGASTPAPAPPLPPDPTQPPPPSCTQAATLAGLQASEPISVFHDLGTPSAARVRALTALIANPAAVAAAAGTDPLAGPPAADAAVVALLKADAILTGRDPASGVGRGHPSGAAASRTVVSGGGGGGGGPPAGRAASLSKGLRRVIALTGDGLPSASASSKARAVDRAAQMADRRIYFELVALAPAASGGAVLGPRALRRAAVAAPAQPFWSGVARRAAAGHGGYAAAPAAATAPAAPTAALPPPPSTLMGGFTQQQAHPTQASLLAPPPPPATVASPGAAAPAAPADDDAPSDDEGLADPESAVTHLRSVAGAARAVSYRRRSLGTYDVRLPGGARFGVSLYAAVRRASMSIAGTVAADTLEPLEVETRGVDATGGRIPLREPEDGDGEGDGGGSRAGGRPTPPPGGPRRARALAGRKPKSLVAVGADGPGLFCGAAAPPRSRLLATPPELAALADGGPRGFTVLGWAPVGPALRPRHAMRPPSFLYPTRDKDGEGADLPGGKAAAVALHAAMLGTEEEEEEEEEAGEAGGGAPAAPPPTPTPARAAVASFVRSHGAKPRLVALVARREVTDADTGAQLTSPGFVVVYLPWADDARRPELTAAVVGHPPFPAALPGAADAAADAVVAALTLPRPPADSPWGAGFGGWTPVPNPVLARQYDILAALALGEGVGGGGGGGGGGWGGRAPQPPSAAVSALADPTLPPWAGKDAALAGEKLAILLDACGAHARPGKPKVTKRPAGSPGGGGGGGGSGRPSPSPGPPEATLASLRAAIARGEGVSLKVADLKAVAKAVGLPVGGRKADLLARLAGGGGGAVAPAACAAARPAPSTTTGAPTTAPRVGGEAAEQATDVSGVGGGSGAPSTRRRRRVGLPPPGVGMEVEPEDSF